MMSIEACSWRKDLDSLSFQPTGHAGCCVIHRRAFGTLLGFEPQREACEQYFAMHRAAFEQAAAAKIRRAGLATQDSLHLNSRDLAGALRESEQVDNRPNQSCTDLDLRSR
jgi:hypothetical protein